MDPRWLRCWTAPSIDLFGAGLLQVTAIVGNGVKQAITFRDGGVCRDHKQLQCLSWVEPVPLKF